MKTIAANTERTGYFFYLGATGDISVNLQQFGQRVNFKFAKKILARCASTVRGDSEHKRAISLLGSHGATAGAFHAHGR